MWTNRSKSEPNAITSEILRGGALQTFFTARMSPGNVDFEDALTANRSKQRVGAALLSSPLEIAYTKLA
jgi:hypothetical protein